MTEVPEYLLARTRERRAAMGGGGGEAASGETAAAPSDTAAAAAPVPAAPAEVAPAEPPPPEPTPPFVEAAFARKKMPVWVVPVMLLLPIWAVYYVGTLEQPPAEATGLLAEGQEIYASSCAGCHGGGGGGGVGPQLNGGEVLLTFPDPGDHIWWVVNGSPEVNGTPYGNPERPGGQRVSAGGMAGWAGTLSTEELVAVVYYERVVHGQLGAEAALAELELLEAYIETGAEFEGGETARDINRAVQEVAAELGAEGETAAG